MTLLGHGHIRCDGHTMVQIALAKVHLITTVGLEGLILQTLEVDELLASSMMRPSRDIELEVPTLSCEIRET